MKQPTRFIKFLGGRDLIFVLTALIFIGITIFIFNKVSFIFHPIIVIFSTISAPIIIGFIVYYIMNPIVNLLEKLHIKRIWGIVIIILGIGGLITGLVFLIAPSIEKQINDLIVEIPIYLQQLGDRIEALMNNSFLSSYYDEGYKWVTSTMSDLPNSINNYIGGAYEGVMSVASTLTNVIVALFTFPFVLFFLLKDSAKFKDYCLGLVPPKFRNDTEHILKNMDVQVGSYIRGQIFVATCIGVLLYLGYLIIGLDYAITLAIIAAITNVVPYLGPVIAISPAIIIALVDSPFMLVKLAIVWAVVQFSEGHFISPNIMGHTMKIHPLTIMFTLLIGGNLFGILGVILGIPGYAIIKVIVVYLYGKFKQRYNRYYGEDAGSYQIDDSADN
ncbi:putative PurR-regulated permease PerM [Virgibacillus halotolerans]|uniref:AI-2E family transporter n=1 Tax=Virgibacillus halotolerans TaxID=1071053 RepID=UPI001961AE73|nr:AI-2E family transporter [Virgibacillus halotolerans]MBM7599604.1 putative PurR-regulated permease PerM [Virgibacillus halotolerans]